MPTNSHLVTSSSQVSSYFLRKVFLDSLKKGIKLLSYHPVLIFCHGTYYSGIFSYLYNFHHLSLRYKFHSNRSFNSSAQHKKMQAIKNVFIKYLLNGQMNEMLSMLIAKWGIQIWNTSVSTRRNHSELDKNWLAWQGIPDLDAVHTRNLELRKERPVCFR